MPYFSHILLSLVPIWLERGSLGTIGVTANGQLMLDPQAVDNWTDKQLKVILLHEAMHILRKHATRKPSTADAFLWNVAADCEINDDLQNANLHLPKEAVTPKSQGFKDGRTAEEYYNLLTQHKDTCKKRKCKICEHPKKPQATGGWCGSGAGNALPIEAQLDEKTPKRTQEELEIVRKETAVAVRKYVQKNQGKVPLGIQRWAGDTLNAPKINWKTQLARHIRKCIGYAPGAVDYCFKRPSRRQSALGYGIGKPVLPILYRPQQNVAVAVDTSGSMRTSDLNAVLDEINGILHVVGTTITLLASDTKVHTTNKIKSIKEVPKQFKGGGGTDFDDVFNSINKLRQKPSILIYATDGYGGVTVPPPKDFSTIWLLLGRFRKPRFYNGEFGTYVEVPY
jgi:predicted metal-dependent peptidase